MDALADDDVRALIPKLRKSGLAFQGATSAFARMIEWAALKVDEKPLPGGAAYVYLDNENRLLREENDQLMQTMHKALSTLQSAMDSIDLLRCKGVRDA